VVHSKLIVIICKSAQLTTPKVLQRLDPTGHCNPCGLVPGKGWPFGRIRIWESTT
jgi:hypothetical protein